MKTSLYRENFLESYIQDEDYRNRIDSYIKYFNKDIEKNVKPHLMKQLYIPKGALQVNYNGSDFIESKRSRYQKATLFSGAVVNMSHYDDNLVEKTAITLPTISYKTKSGDFFRFIVNQHLIMQNGINYILPQGIVTLASMPLI